MTKRYKVLRKKLKELNEVLVCVFSVPGDNIPCQQLLSEEIEQRFLFLKNLLSAEIASNPSKPHHLHHIAQRLDDLETAFREWDDHRTTSAADANNFDETTSICSCDDSCRDDDGEANYNEDDVMPDLDSNSVREEGLRRTDPEGLVDVNVEQDTVKKVESGRAGKSYCGGLISGLIFGGWGLMAVIMLRFSGCFYFAVNQSFLVPT